MPLTTAEVAARLGITPGRVRQLITEERLPATRHGRDWSIAEADLAAFRLPPLGWPKGKPRKEQPTMDVLEIAGYSPYTAHDAAEIVNADGRVLARVPEPRARADTRAGLPLPWNEAAWQLAVRDAALTWLDAYRRETPGVPPTGYTVVWDPGRDETAEEGLA